MNRKKTSKFLALILCVSSVSLIAAGCTGGGEGTQTEITTVNTLDDDIDNPVDISDVEVENAKTLENPNITYLGYYDMRIAGDIKPAVKLFEDTYGGKIEYYPTSWAERSDKLATLILSDESPDLVDKDGNTFPHLMSLDMYEDLTDYIDLSLPQWEGMGDIIESFKWGDAHYYYPFVTEASPYWLMYNESIFDEYGIDNPRELYDAGEWDWNAYRQCMLDYVDNVPDARCGYYGVNGFDIIASTGTPFIGMDDGKLVSNMKSPEVERAANFLEELRREGLAFRGEGMYNQEPEPLVQGLSAFQGIGIWRFATYCIDYPEMGINLVPFPRDPSADDYYYSVSTFGYLVPKGSKNIEGGAEFINMIRLVQTDPELGAITKQSEMNDKGYTSEQYDFIKSFQKIGNFKFTNDTFEGFNPDLNTAIADMVGNITFETGENSKSWSQLRDEYEILISEGLNEYNSTISE